MTKVYYTIAMQVSHDSCTLRKFDDLDGALNHSFAYFRLMCKKSKLRCHINHYKDDMLCNQFHYTLFYDGENVLAKFDKI